VFAWLILLATVVLSSASATAQMPPDFESRKLTRDDMEFIGAARPFADCLVAQNAKEIPKILGTHSSRNVWLARDMAKNHPDCARPKSLGKDATFLLQSALLEALIRRDFGSAAAPTSFNHLPPFLYVKDSDSALSKELFANLIEPYDCTTRRDPTKVQALLRTQPLSAEEGAAFAALRATLVACHPKGEKWEMQAYFARRFLAETFYTLMKVDQRAKAGTK
jgi:hypothetical protein